MKSPSRSGRQPGVTHARSAHNWELERRESQGAMVHRDYASSLRPSEYFPSSFWAQRSAQPAGINKSVLSERIRIVIVAFGSAPIPDDFRFATGYDGGFHPHTPDKGLRPLTSYSLRVCFKMLSQISIPFTNPYISAAEGFTFLYPHDIMTAG